MTEIVIVIAIPYPDDMDLEDYEDASTAREAAEMDLAMFDEGLLDFESFIRHPLAEIEMDIRTTKENKEDNV